MKTAEKWQEELARETSVQSIRAIQADALFAAIVLVTRHRKTDAVITAIAREADALLSPNATHHPRAVASRGGCSCSQSDKETDR